MNSFVFYLLIVLILVLIIYMILKKQKVNTLNKAIHAEDWKTVIELTKTKSANYLLSPYIRDFYCAKAYQMNGDIELLKAHLRVMFKNAYKVEDTGQYLVLYYHLYMICEDYSFAQEILAVIQKTCNKKVITYCVWTKEVLIDRRCDLIEEMEKTIDSKTYYAFPLGVVCYLVGVQKKIGKQYKDALIWFETALTVFQKKDLYVETLKKEIAELRAKGVTTLDE